MENKVVQRRRTVEKNPFVLTGGEGKITDAPSRLIMILCRETLHSHLILTEPRCCFYFFAIVP